MSGFSSILWQEYIIFKRKFWAITTGAMVSPILYLIAFGWGLGGGVKVDGKPYILFVIPGIIALTTMIVSYNNIANSINISRIFYKTFEGFMTAPISVFTYALGKIVAGALRGLYSGALIILLAVIFRIGITITPYFILIIVLNCLVFSAIGFTVGIIINSHADMSNFSNFVITPMSFLCGTFFSLNKMPVVIKGFIWILPLTHTSLGLRSSGEDFISMMIHPAILIIYFIVIFGIGIKCCKKAE